MSLIRRFFDNNDNDCFDDDNQNISCNNAWNDWARWVVLAVVIVGAFLIFFLFSCITARRRRRMGYSPYRGTGWTLGMTPPGHAPAQYTQQPYIAPQNEQQAPYYNNSNNPPPAYGANQGYYGRDVEMQSPPVAYKAPMGGMPGR